MGAYVLGFQEIDLTQVAVVGGKGAHLGELSRIEGIRVPAGFCVTTDAFQRIMAEAPSIDDPLDRLSRLNFKKDDREAIRALSAEIRRTIEGIAIPDDLATAITSPLARLGEQAAYAVRSSATAEDLPTASFAGQQDTYLNVVGPPAIEPERQEQPALTDAQVVRLARLGRRIEAHLGRPQDIEWCLVDDDFLIVQGRPITTLFPIPAQSDRENHVYISVGHQQMMTDPMKPLGLSFWQMTTPRPMAEAGGRLFVDVTQILASPASRAGLLAMAGKSDPLIGDALQTIVDRDDFLPPPPDAGPGWEPPSGGAAAPIETDPAIVAELIGRSQASIAALKRDIQAKSGSALLDFILADMQELKQILFDPRSRQVFMLAMEAAWWLNDQLQAWLGEKNASDTLTQSVPNNVTSEMGLALLDVADVIRPHPGVVAFLEHVEDDGFLDELAKLAGGREARDAIRAWLDKYGMRCVGEIDITKPRWSERPTTLVPVILGNIQNFAPGAAARRFEQGRQEARKKEEELLERLRALPDGEQKAEETKRMIDRVRTFAGYREYPKYRMVSRYFVYKQALMEEAGRLVQAGVVRDKEDIFYLRFEEL